MVSIGTIGGFVNSRNILTIHGLSTDEKPIDSFQNCKIGNSSVFIEMDTHREYFYDEENRRWIPKMTYIVSDGLGSSSDSDNKEIITKNTFSEFPETGKVDVIYVDKENKLSYIWNPESNSYEPVGDGNSEAESITSEELAAMWGND